MATKAAAATVATVVAAEALADQTQNEPVVETFELESAVLETSPEVDAATAAVESSGTAETDTETKFAATKKQSAKAWPTLLTLLFGLLGFSALFLPAVTMRVFASEKWTEISVSFWQSFADPTSRGLSVSIMIFLLAASVLLSLIYLVARKTWLRYVTSTFAIITGSWAATSALYNWQAIAQTEGAIDSGLILMLISGLALIVSGIVMLALSGEHSKEQALAEQ